MSRVAVIGSGISGMSAAYFLSRKHEVWLFENQDRLGGHTHTHAIDGHQIDTGFIVYNERTYPNLVKLLADLGVASQPSDMSFSVFHPSTSFVYSSNGLDGFFADRRNLFRPSHYRLGMDILRFNKESPRLLETNDDVSLADYLEREKYSQIFKDLYLYPMASAIWSTSLGQIGQFPALTLIRFFANHNLLSVGHHHVWQAVKGGSSSYIEPLTRTYRDRIVLNTKIQSIVSKLTGIEIRMANGDVQSFDEIVFACNAQQALAMLPDATEKERAVLSNFHTSENRASLHTDETLLPKQGAARASWNCILGGDGGAALTYHMNRLQNLPGPLQYCVTLNAGSLIDPTKLLRTLEYRHPLYTLKAVAAQQRWHEISGQRHIHFCGAYWFYGFHEDGLNSGMRVARQLGVDC